MVRDFKILSHPQISRVHSPLFYMWCVTVVGLEISCMFQTFIKEMVHHICSCRCLHGSRFVIMYRQIALFFVLQSEKNLFTFTPHAIKPVDLHDSSIGMFGSFFFWLWLSCMVSAVFCAVYFIYIDKGPMLWILAAVVVCFCGLNIRQGVGVGYKTQSCQQYSLRRAASHSPPKILINA